MKNLALFLTVVLVLSPQPLFAEAPTDEDKAQIDRQIGEVITAMRRSDAKGAVNSFFKTSKMLQLNDPRLLNLTNQLSNAVSLYGPVSSCSHAKWKAFSALVLNKQIVCAHDKYATRWKFTLAKLPSGWSAVSLIFDDDIDKGPF